MDCTLKASVNHRDVLKQFKQALLYTAFTVAVLLRPDIALVSGKCESSLFGKSDTQSSFIPLTTEATLRQSIHQLSLTIAEFHSLEPIPSSYFNGQYQDFPRVQWLKKHTEEVAAQIPYGYFNNVYSLEQLIKKTTDKKIASELYLELANEYLRSENIEGAILTALRAKRFDLAKLMANKIKYSAPRDSFLHTPREGLTEYLEQLKSSRSFYKKELADVIKSTVDSRWNELELEAKRLKKSADPKDQSESKKLYSKIAEDYLENNMYQEAIWTFRKAGHFARASEIQKELLEIMLNNPLILTKDELGGVTKSKVYQLAPGVKVIAKIQTGMSQGSQSPHNEILAYQISEVMEMDAVSTTVLREVDGRVASLQVLVQENTTYSRWIEQPREDIKTSFAIMDTFDYLIANQDRYNHMGAHNQIWRYGYNQVLIDHGIAFKPRLLTKNLPGFKNLNENKDVINDERHKLENRMPSPEFIQMLEDLGRPEKNRQIKSLFFARDLSINYQVFEYRRKQVLKEIKRIQDSRALN